MAKAVKKPRKNGYKMPDPLPKGEILTDISKCTWKLGSSIGKGGFGEIYAAQRTSKSSSDYPFVVKVEPHGNGPLFVEMHFYMKNAKQADIDAFKERNKLKTFGMPAYIGSGSHETETAKYRFVVMEKFGSDIDKLRQANNGTLPVSTVYQVSWQMVYVLEYIHEFGYVHADIKGGNILLGVTPETKNQAFLIDFGLATKFSTEKEFKPNPKKAHDGTIEYLSRDAHQGVPTRRGDIEILAYNIIHWLGGHLPWESKLSDPKTVQQIKEDSMKDIPKFLKTCFETSGTSQECLTNLLQYVQTLKFNQEPDYKKIRQFFEAALKKHGATIYSPLQAIGTNKTHVVECDVPTKEKKEKVITSRKRVIQSKSQENGDAVVEEVLTDAMKGVLARKAQKGASKKKIKNKVNGEEATAEDCLEGYTPEMIEIKNKMQNNITKRQKKVPATEEEKNHEVRPRRKVPVVNYEEHSPKLRKK